MKDHRQEEMKSWAIFYHTPISPVHLIKGSAPFWESTGHSAARRCLYKCDPLWRDHQGLHPLLSEQSDLKVASLYMAQRHKGKYACNQLKNKKFHQRNRKLLWSEVLRLAWWLTGLKYLARSLMTWVQFLNPPVKKRNDSWKLSFDLCMCDVLCTFPLPLLK